MIAVGEMVARDLAAMEAELGDRCEWQGEEYPCTAGEGAQSMTLLAEGQEAHRTVTITIRRECFLETEPAVGDSIYYPPRIDAHTKGYRISDITPQRGDSALIMTCEGVHQ